MELPTITFEEALKKEEEYKKKLKATHPRPVGSNLYQAPIKVRICVDVILLNSVLT
jgi:hypothetical protein